MFVILLAVGLGYYIGSKRCCNGCVCKETSKIKKNKKK
jgi:hypothetical protein